MPWLVFGPVLLGCMILQNAAVRPLGFGGDGPDLVLALAVFFAARASDRDWPIGAWLAGVGADACGGGPFGVCAVAFLGAAAMTAAVRDRLAEGPVGDFLTTVLAAFAGQGLVLGLLLAAGAWRESLFAGLRHGAFVALLTAVAAPFLFAVFRRTRMFPRRRRSGWVVDLSRSHSQ